MNYGVILFEAEYGNEKYVVFRNPDIKLEPYWIELIVGSQRFSPFSVLQINEHRSMANFTCSHAQLTIMRGLIEMLPQLEELIVFK